MSKMKLTTTGQIRRVKTLIADFTTALMNNVHELECPSPRTAPDKISTGAVPATSLRGYAYLLQSHQLRHYDTLSADDFNLLEKQSGILLQLAKDTETLNNYFGTEGVLAKLGRQTRKSINALSPALSSYVTTLYNTLSREGEVSMVSGNPWMGGQQAHFTITKLTAQQSEIHATTYNAGFETNRSSSAPDLVMGIERRILRDSSEAAVKNFICLHAEKRHTAEPADYARIKKTLEAMLGNHVTHSDVTPQHKGNCTTRSTREWLRDTLPHALYSPIYELASSRSSDQHATLLLLHSRLLESKLQQEQSQLKPLLNKYLCAASAALTAMPPATESKRKDFPENNENDKAKRQKRALTTAPELAPSRYPHLRITLPPRAASYVAREVAMQDVFTTKQHGRS